MKQITNAQYEEFQKYLRDKINGRILTLDGLWLICQANDYDTEKIGRFLIEMLEWQQNRRSRDND